MNFGVRDHRSTLEESLVTCRTISFKRFLKLLSFYKPYAFDNRCNQYIYIAKNLKLKYFWLYIQFNDLQEYLSFKIILQAFNKEWKEELYEY